MDVKFYRVGGCVRDEILGQKSKDIDYSVVAPSFDAMRQEIVGRGGEVFLETPKYLTIRAKVPKLGACDFVLCRKDGQYTDGRRPNDVEMGTLEDDLARRDFTMNAIAEDEDGNHIDPHDGRKDIASGIIKCVGKAEDRFAEDYLRLLRAFRFSITKEMELFTDVRVCLYDEKFVSGLKHVSVERIREEMFKAFMHDTHKTLLLLERYKALRDVLFESGALRLKPTLEL